jgi:Rps23 Pro-64 3,4-dihydroxylase Tpa1-like proline 4-hydroxylase
MPRLREPSPPMSIIHPEVLASRAQHARALREAQPFRHVVIDGFLDPQFCERVLSDFPRFEDKYALNEMGQVGGKAVRMDVRDISDTFRTLDRHIQTPEFLDLVSEITGIPELLYDADYVGGGTHENVHGQGLDPHVDFNYHPGTRTHRRLNLIVYLNHEWDAAWGGALELHSDPWNERGNQVKRVQPLFNRCVIFETNEVSWHGFQRIVLPEERRTLSRKSFAIYLYTRDRPPAETAASHATIYVPDTRPADVAEGTTLTRAQVADLDQRFGHLRGQLRFLYERERHFTAQIVALERALADSRAAFKIDLQGFAVQPRGASGVWPDGWAAQVMSFAFTPTRRARELVLDLWVPPKLGGEQVLRITVGKRAVEETIRAGSRRTLQLPIASGTGETVEVWIDASRAWSPKASGESEDERALAYKIVAASLEH